MDHIKPWTFLLSLSDVFANAFGDFIFISGEMDTSLVYHNYIHIKNKKYNYVVSKENKGYVLNVEHFSFGKSYSLIEGVYRSNKKNYASFIPLKQFILYFWIFIENNLNRSTHG